MRRVLTVCAPAAVFLLLFAFTACSSEPETPSPQAQEASIPFEKEGTLDFLRNGQPIVTIDIEIADTDSARERGLMQRTSLPERSGMLFIFDREEPQSFWMANTPLSLDLYFVNADSQIVRIAKYTRPLSPSSIASEAPAQYVIETAAGFADTYGIVEGDRVRWRRTAPEGAAPGAPRSPAE